MKENVIFLNWQAVKNLAATGKTVNCAICGGAKSAKATVCKNCVATFRDAAKTVKEAVAAYQIPIEKVENSEWQMLQKVCASVDRKNRGNDLEATLQLMFNRFSPDLIKSIVEHYRKWNKCCAFVKNFVSADMNPKGFGHYATVLQNRHESLRALTHGMVQCALNFAYNDAKKEVEAKKIIAELSKRMIKVICTDNSNDPEDAFVISQKELANNTLIKKLEDHRILIVNRSGSDVPLYELRREGLMFLGLCNRVVG